MCHVAHCVARGKIAKKSGRAKRMFAQEVRVKAQGIGGAAMKAVRQVKHERESKRRVLQTRITVVPVGRGMAAS